MSELSAFHNEESGVSLYHVDCVPFMEEIKGGQRQIGQIERQSGIKPPIQFIMVGFVSKVVKSKWNHFGF